MARGGYREPSHPAPVSNPGAGSARTDGGPVHAAEALAGGKYGAAQQAGQMATSANMAPTGGASVGSQALGQALSQGGLNFGAASAQPGTPVTAGANSGPGPDASVLDANNPAKQEAMQLAQNGTLAVMIRIADSDDASDSYRQYVRALLALVS